MDGQTELFPAPIDRISVNAHREPGGTWTVLVHRQSEGSRQFESLHYRALGLGELLDVIEAAVLT